MHTSSRVSNELDQYLSEPLFARNQSVKLMAPGGANFFSIVALIVIIYKSRPAALYFIFQIDLSEKIGISEQK